ncbi:MAG: hypothetical protein M3T96_11430 [Acidobacteriota bacterium]|nr:hypothetical protein [Acidobacteriota bacterium]
MTTKFTNPLENLKIASPCSQDWEQMIGTERRRYCGECKLNVYNLSGMTRKEAENLIHDSNGNLCVRFFKRADGTVLTEDCPVGWRAFKKRVSVGATAFASVIFSLISGLGAAAMFNQLKIGEVMGDIAVYQPTPKPTPERNYPIMGAIAAPSPTPKATPKPQPSPKDVPLMGKPLMPGN